MNNASRLRRRICLGLGMGLASNLAWAGGLGRAFGSAGEAVEDVGGVRYTTVHDFAGLAGPEADSGILLASDGNGYAVTGRGGTRNLGTIYRITPGKDVKVLHSFGGKRQGDGNYPVAPLIEVGGALYGVTSEGGSTNGGVAFRLAHDTGYTVLHDFGVTPGDASLCWGGLLFASDGHFYGASYYGGTNNRGLVYRMDMAGTVTPVWHLGAAGAPAFPLAAVIERADGRLYGTTRGGGALGHGTIYSVAKDGSDLQVVFSFNGLNGSSPQVPLLETADGGLYGVTTIGGTHGRGTAYRLAPGGVHTVLHSFTGGEDGREPNTELLMVEPGVFMGTTTFGGGGGLGSGVAYVVHDDGTYRRLHRFGGTVHGKPDGAWPTGALCRAAGGQVVGVCRIGGANGQGTIWKMTPVPA